MYYVPIRKNGVSLVGSRAYGNRTVGAEMGRGVPVGQCGSFIDGPGVGIFVRFHEGVDL